MPVAREKRKERRKENGCAFHFAVFPFVYYGRELLKNDLKRKTRPEDL